MTNISSNSIFHFTSSKENLKGILSDNFKIKYCRELMPFKEEELGVYVPMVSFCEIPLSRVKDHVSKYGGYGVGLDRSWAIRNRLNPVTYVEKDSNLAASYYSAIKYYFTVFDELDDEKKRELKNFCEFLRYMKPYQGVLRRQGIVKDEDYRFSDECEWRYVIPLESNTVALLHAADFEIDGVREEAATSLENERLSFVPSDIKYIFIDNELEISEFCDHLRNLKGSRYSHNDVERLMTRIITMSQIKEDF